MNLIYKITFAVMIFAGGAAAQSTSGNAGTPTKSYSDEYGVIVQKNIFLKDRRSSNTTRTRPTYDPPPPVPVEKTYTLIGVVVGDQDSRAYFEHSGRIVHMTVGETIGQGKIAAIEVSGIKYEAKDAQTLIQVGHDLTGAVGSSQPTYSRPLSTTTPAAAPASAASATTTPAAPSGTEGAGSESAGAAPTAAPTAGGDDNLSVIERMRRKRQQEGGK